MRSGLPRRGTVREPRRQGRRRQSRGLDLHFRTSETATTGLLCDRRITRTALNVRPRQIIVQNRKGSVFARVVLRYCNTFFSRRTAAMCASGTISQRPPRLTHEPVKFILLKNENKKKDPDFFLFRPPPTLKFNTRDESRWI